MMAKTARKKTAAKAKKSKRAAVSSRSKVKAKAKTVARKAPAKKRAKAKPEGIRSKIAKAFHAVVETIEDTQKLRDKLEPPGVSESE